MLSHRIVNFIIWSTKSELTLSHRHAQALTHNFPIIHDYTNKHRHCRKISEIDTNKQDGKSTPVPLQNKLWKKKDENDVILYQMN